jgi:hypothetical protein
VGFIGFFDLDNLAKITREDIRHAVSSSCAMIVCLHDETLLSEVCGVVN